MPDLTPAQQQAEFLTALASHLRAHPHLPVANTHAHGRGGWQLHIIQDGASGLIAWARSLGAEELSAMAITDATWSAVKVCTRMGSFQVDTYARVDDFPRDVMTLTLADLEHFAQYGTLPEAGGCDA